MVLVIIPVKKINKKLQNLSKIMINFGVLAAEIMIKIIIKIMVTNNRFHNNKLMIVNINSNNKFYNKELKNKIELLLYQIAKIRSEII